MLKSRLLGAVGIVAVVGGIADAPIAQTRATAFDTISIKPGRNLGPKLGPQTRTASFESSGRFTASNATLRMLLVVAYRGAWPPPLWPPLQMEGGPDWQDHDGFDIEASTSGAPPLNQMELMVRALLADRFALRTHEDPDSCPRTSWSWQRRMGPLARSFGRLRGRAPTRRALLLPIPVGCRVALTALGHVYEAVASPSRRRRWINSRWCWRVAWEPPSSTALDSPGRST
jgi:hypothetical protein